MMRMTVPFAIISILLLSAADAGCEKCSCYGDPHVSQCDGSNMDVQAEGQFQIFKTDTVEVQCIFVRSGPGADVTSVDVCQVNIKGQNGCEMSFRDGGVKSPGKYKAYGQDVDKEGAKAAFDQAPADMKMKFNLVNDNEYIITVDTGAQGSIKVHKINQAISVNAPTATQCSGLCGSCTGNVKPTDPMAFAKKVCTDGGVPAAGDGTKCPKTGGSPSSQAPTSVPQSSKPPTTPSQAPTSVPQSSKPPTTPSPSPAKFIPIPESKIVQHPSFESEKVMSEVIIQCCGGRDSSEMKNDPLFATFVENCIYDKSMGAGAETAAVSTMESYIRMAALDNHQPASGNGTKSPSKAPKHAGNKTQSAAPKKKLDTSLLLAKTVTKPGSQIPMGQGVTYQLQHTAKPLPSVPLDENLLPRSSVFSGAGVTSSISESDLKAMKKGVKPDVKVTKKKHNKKKEKDC